MNNLNVPGIYVSEQKYVLNSLRIDKRCLAGFVGIAERGVLHTPVLISSFDEYIKIFGSFDTAGNLPFAVYSYFKCGGSECVVVRVANEEHAARAHIDIECGKGKVVLEAKSEGIWGNYISARIWHENEHIKKILNVDIKDGKWICLDLGEDDDELSVNDNLRILLFGNSVFRTIAKRDGNKYFLDTPLTLLRKVQNPLEDLRLEKVFVSLTLSCKGRYENFLHLSMNPSSKRYYLSYINDRCSFCSVSAYEPTSVLKPVFAVQAVGGADGIAEMSDLDFIGYYNGPGIYKGLGAMESRDDISLLAIPDASWLLSGAGKTEEEKEKSSRAVYTAMINQAERFHGRFAILDMPNKLEGLSAIKWAKKFDSPFASAYYPYIDILDPLDASGAKTVRVPPSGAVCGCIAATDRTKGIFHAPANILIQGAVGLSARITDAEYEVLYPTGINLLKYFPGRGIKIWGARTLSSNPDWRYINVRRTFSSICKSLKTGTQWAVYETNNKNLRKRLVRHVSGFLLDLWMEGYLCGNTPEQGYFVRCDEELNPPENIDNGIITFAVGLAITKPTEFYSIIITAEKEGASVYIKEE